MKQLLFMTILTSFMVAHTQTNPESATNQDIKQMEDARQKHETQKEQLQKQLQNISNKKDPQAKKIKSNIKDLQHKIHDLTHKIKKKKTQMPPTTQSQKSAILDDKCNHQNSHNKNMLLANEDCPTTY